MIPNYRYPCTCLEGSQHTPVCPHKQIAEIAALNRASSDLEYRTRMRRRQMERAGLIAPEPVNPWRFRWWWIPLGLTVYIVLLILI